jgi:hypothetical protein
MPEIYKILLTSSLTVIGGIFILAVGQIIVKFIIEPLQEQSKLIGGIANSLIFYANVGAATEPYYYNKLQEANKLEEPLRKLVVERYEEIIRSQWRKSDNAEEILRQQASQLMGRTHAIPFYALWAFLGRKPRGDDIIEASTRMIRMANETHQSGPDSSNINEIAKRLRIKIVSKRFGKT